MDEEVIVTDADIVSIASWSYLLQGVFAILFGVFALFWTLALVDLIAYFIGALIILYSISTILKGVSGTDQSTNRWLLIILGIIGVIIGIIAVLDLGILWLTLAYLIAIWAFASGFGDLWLALTQKEFKWFRVLLFITGILGLLLGFFMVLFPGIGDIVIIQVVGIFAVAMGIVTIINGFFIQKQLKA